MDIDEREREELLSRWQRCRADDDTPAGADAPIAELIEEACRGACVGRVSAERCARAGDAFGRTWSAAGRDLPSLADEFSLLRRSVWDTVAARLRAEAAVFDAVVEARAMIDLVFDIAMRRALGAIGAPAAESGPDLLVGPETSEQTVQAVFYRALDDAIETCATAATPLALVIGHVEVGLGPYYDAGGTGADPFDVSEVVRAQLRRRDRFFAISESDFAILSTGQTAAGARALLARIASAIAVYGAGAGATIETTGGLAVAPEDGITSLELIRIALADREFSIPGAPDAARA